MNELGRPEEKGGRFIYFTTNFTQFQDAVKAAVLAYLPELSAEKELNQITLFLADYHGVSY